MKGHLAVGCVKSESLAPNWPTASKAGKPRSAQVNMGKARNKHEQIKPRVHKWAAFQKQELTFANY